MRSRLTRIARQLLRSVGIRLEAIEDTNFFQSLLYRRLALSPKFFFVQIGANDGISSDPIYEFVTRERVSGIVVEPLSDYYRQLVRNYAAYRSVTPVNCAIHATERWADIHRVDPSRSVGQPWAGGIGSLTKDFHKLSGTPDDCIIQERVACMTFDELLQTHSVTHIDLLQIDTEGYDAEILKMIDFSRVKPAIINFEHGIQDGIMSLDTLGRSIKLLHDHGYSALVQHYDVTAYLP